MKILLTKRIMFIALGLTTLLTLTHNILHAKDEELYWMKVRATDKFERTEIENLGHSIELIREDYVVVYGDHNSKNDLKKRGLLESSFPLLITADFPTNDADFHNYQELTTALQKMASENADIVKLDSLGETIEGREIWHLTLSTELPISNQKPGVAFMGGHHAREHLSVDVPLRLTQNLIKEFREGNPRAINLLQGRQIHIIPMVNPDGAEYDILNEKYKMWRKNRRVNNDGSYGVDLNRNYSYNWGTGGSSKKPSSDTYMGPQPFSEPETTAIKTFLEQQSNISILLTFHTFSELILYPWGHSYDPITDGKDRSVYQKMAQQMSQWNQYSPMQTSELYQASGDTTDWAYGTLKIFSFTFELDPQNTGSARGFYPGDEVISSVVKKNWDPFLYLIEYSDNPYRVLDSSLSETLGLSN